MSETKNYRYEQAASMVKVQGILSIIFGGLGSLAGLIFMIFVGVDLVDAYSYEVIGLSLLLVGSIIFWLLPHVYFIVSGITLLNLPEPNVAKALTIINLVIGVFWNLILVIFAIIVLTQSADYASGKQPQKK